MAMWCRLCGSRTREVVCASCTAELVRGGEVVAPSGLSIAAAFEHRGPVRSVVHRVKYDADRGAAAWLAQAMRSVAPPDATGWVPVPRARVRAIRYGVDPARLFAELLADASGIPVVPVLGPAWWWASHSRGLWPQLSSPRFTVRTQALDARWVLVDDVATSGATLDAARRALGGHVRRAVVATAVRTRLSRL